MIIAGITADVVLCLAFVLLLNVVIDSPPPPEPAPEPTAEIIIIEVIAPTETPSATVTPQPTALPRATVVPSPTATRIRVGTEEPTKAPYVFPTPIRIPNYAIATPTKPRSLK